MSINTSFFQGVTTEDPELCNRKFNEACDLLDEWHETADDALESSLPWLARRDGKRRRMPAKPVKPTKSSKSSPPSPHIKEEVAERRSLNKADHLEHVISYVYCSKSGKSEQVDTHAHTSRPHVYTR